MRIGCAVVTHDSAAQVPSLLWSVSTLDLHALVVVDNDSRDRTVEVVRGWTLPFASTVIRRTNDGYAAGANAALRELRRRGTELVLLLNPDTVVVRADLDALDDLFRSAPTVGSLCPVMLAPGGERFDSLGLRLTAWASVGDAGQGKRSRPIGTAALPRVIGPCGGGAVYRLAALETVAGPFDERFFLYYEDADLALRLRRCGWGTVTSDVVTLEHGRSGLGSLRGDAGGDGWAAALRHRQASYETFVRHAPLPAARRVAGALGARARRAAVRRRLAARGRAAT